MNTPVFCTVENDRGVDLPQVQQAIITIIHGEERPDIKLIFNDGDVYEGKLVGLKHFDSKMRFVVRKKC